MSTAITNAGENAIALHQNQETALVIDKFILAMVDGVDPEAAVDRTEGLPDPADIVFEYDIPEEYKGYINPNQVVYSMMIGSDIGDFNFNWVGLYSSADDAVIAIAYTPTLSKWKTVNPLMGNSMTRNFMLEYSGLQATTQITIEASTWQIDFTARLKGIDERERLSNLDIYGGACFFSDGYLVVNDAGTLKVSPGIGYVEGVRIELDAEQTISPTLPAEVYLDVSLQPQDSDRVAVASIVFANPGDYVDGTNNAHYGQKIAGIDAAGVVTDMRPSTLAGAMGNVVAVKDHPHKTADVTDLLSGEHAWDKGQRYAPKELGITDNAVIWDCKAKPSAVLLLNDDVTSLTISNYDAGGSYDLAIIQDGTGGRTCTMPAGVYPVEGEGYEVSTEAGARDLIQLLPVYNPNTATVEPWYMACNAFAQVS